MQVTGKPGSDPGGKALVKVMINTRDSSHASSSGQRSTWLLFFPERSSKTTNLCLSCLTNGFLQQSPAGTALVLRLPGACTLCRCLHSPPGQAQTHHQHFQPPAQHREHFCSLQTVCHQGRAPAARHLPSTAAQGRRQRFRMLPLPKGSTALGAQEEGGSQGSSSTASKCHSCHQRKREQGSELVLGWK